MIKMFSDVKIRPKRNTIITTVIINVENGKNKHIFIYILDNLIDISNIISNPDKNKNKIFLDIKKQFPESDENRVWFQILTIISVILKVYSC